MDFRLKNLPTRHGTAQGDSTERQMVAQLDTDDFRSARRDNADGSTTYVKTRGGFVHYWTDDSQGGDTASVVIKRGFAIFMFVLASSQFVNKGKTLVSWVGTVWKRVKQESLYAASTGYAVVTGKMECPVSVLPEGVSAIQHLDQACHDVAMIHVPDSGKRTLVVNTIPLRTIPDNLITGVPVLTPVIVSGRNTYPKSNVDARGYHLFLVNATRAQHLWCYADTPYGDYESTNGAALPPLADVAGKTFDSVTSPMESRMWEVAYTKSGSTLLNLYHRYVKATLSLVPPYVSGGVPIVVTRQFYVFYDMSVGASVGQNLADTWTNSPTVPDLQIFDFYDSLVGTATNGNPDYFNTYYRFVQAVSSPSVPGVGGPNQTDTRTFSNTIVRNDSYALNSTQNLVVDTSISVNYTMVHGQGSLYQTYNGGGPDVDVGNVPAGSNDAQPGSVPKTSAFVGDLLQATANGSHTTYDNTASTSVVHTLDSLVLFSFSSSLTLHSETKTGWYATGRGSIGRGYLDGRLWAEDASWASSYGSATRQAAEYAVGWAIGIPDFAGSQVWYNGVDEHSVSQDDTLIKTYFDGVPVTSFSRSSSAQCRDYIFSDVENGVFVFVKGSFSGTNVNINSTDGASTLKVELVVSFAGIERSVVLYEATQSGGCNVSAQTTEFVAFADYDPTHIPAPAAPSIYVPRCEQGDFKYIAYTTSAEHADGVSPRMLLSLPLYLAQRDQPGDTYPQAAGHAYVFRPHNLEECSGMFGTGVFSYLQDKVFHFNVSHEGVVDWLLKLNVFGQTPDHYAECYRT